MDYAVKQKPPSSEAAYSSSEAPAIATPTAAKTALAAIAPNANVGHVYDEPVRPRPQPVASSASSGAAPPLSFGQASLHVLRNIPGADAVQELVGALLPGAETLHATAEFWEGNQTIGDVLKTAGSETVDYVVDKSASRLASMYGTGKALYQYQSGEGSPEDIAFAAAGMIGGRKLADVFRGWWPRRKDPKAQKTEFEESLRKDPIAARNALDALNAAKDGKTRKAALRMLADSVDMPACLERRGNCANAAKSLILAIKHDASVTSIPYRKPPRGLDDPNRDYNPDDYLDPGTGLTFNRYREHRNDMPWIRSELGIDRSNSWSVDDAELRKFLDHGDRLEEGQLGILYQQKYRNDNLTAHELVVTRIDGELIVVNNSGGNVPAQDRVLSTLSEWQQRYSSDGTDAKYHVVMTDVFLPGTASADPPGLWELKRK